MTGRLPFNARNTSAAAGSNPARGSPSPDRPLSVSTLAGMITDALAQGLPRTIRVAGEVSGFRERTHWYFDLKDSQSVLPCAVFASSVRRLGFQIQDGQEVVLTGRLDLYAKTGKLSFIATRVEPVGAGALELEFRRLVESLRSKGWFDPERKRPVPRFPRKVAVVTSRSGAALQDVVDTMARRAKAVGIIVADARVQGDGAAAEVIDAIRVINHHADVLGVDVILVTRGGGSMQDLWAFNDPELAETILHSRLPVVAAVGHETDVTIAELVADLRAATPTQGAMAVTPDAEALLEQVGRQQDRLSRAAQRLVASSRQRLGQSTSRRTLRNPGLIVHDQRAALSRLCDSLRGTIDRAHRDRRSRLDRLALRLARLRPTDTAAREHAARRERLAAQSARLRAAAVRSINARAAALEAMRREMQAVAPIAVLRRGFSVTLDASGRAIRSIEQAPDGTRLETQLADGSVMSVVGGRGDRSRAPKVARRAQKREHPDQLGLFRGERSSPPGEPTPNEGKDPG